MGFVILTVMPKHRFFQIKRIGDNIRFKINNSTEVKFHMILLGLLSLQTGRPIHLKMFHMTTIWPVRRDTSPDVEEIVRIRGLLKH